MVERVKLKRLQFLFQLLPVCWLGPFHSWRDQGGALLFTSCSDLRIHRSIQSSKPIVSALSVSFPGGNSNLSTSQVFGYFSFSFYFILFYCFRAALPCLMYLHPDVPLACFTKQGNPNSTLVPNYLDQQQHLEPGIELNWMYFLTTFYHREVISRVYNDGLA